MTEWASRGQEALIAREHAEGKRVSALARDHGYSRSGIYALLERCRARERREQRRERREQRPAIPTPRPLAELPAQEARQERRPLAEPPAQEARQERRRDQGALSRWLSL